MKEKAPDKPAQESAKTLDRVLARSIDLLIACSLYRLFSPLGAMAAVLYLSIADGIFPGKSLGKRLIRLKVVSFPEQNALPRRDQFQASLVRNLPFALAFFLASIAVIGWLLAFIIGIPLLLIETYLVVYEENGIRLGDLFAKTMVIHEHDDADA